MYIYANTYDMYTNFVPKLHGRYLSSNVNITVYDEHNKSVSVPVGGEYERSAVMSCLDLQPLTQCTYSERYAKFTTRK